MKPSCVRAGLVEAFCASAVRGLPASRGLPGGNSLFFCAAKRKVSKRKGDPTVCDPCATLRGNLRCSVQPGPGSNSLRSDNRPSLSVWTSAPRRSQKGRGDRIGSGAGFGTGIGLRRGRAKRVLASPHQHPNPNPNLFPHPLGWTEERRQKRIRARDCLSRRRVRARPRFCRAPQVARSEAQGPRLSGRLFFGDLLLATQKKVTCRRATPGLLANHRPWNQETASTGSARTVERATLGHQTLPSLPKLLQRASALPATRGAGK